MASLSGAGCCYDSTRRPREMFARERVTAYVGFDPTASSLHVGSLLPIMALARLQRAGHRPIALVGGGTGLIGDPSGKSQERTLLTLEDVERTSAGMRRAARALPRLRRRPPNAARMLNNADWLRPDHAARVPARHRQALHRQLHAGQGIGEAAAGRRRRDLVHRVQLLSCCRRTTTWCCTSASAARCRWAARTSGATSPPAAISFARWRAAKRTAWCCRSSTTAAGTKFGKTEAGTVWLDPARTSPFRFYQFWLNTDDRDVVTLPEVVHVARSRRRSRNLERARCRGAGQRAGAADAGAAK